MKSIVSTDVSVYCPSKNTSHQNILVLQFICYIMRGVSMSKCKNCGVEFTGRKDAKFCSPNCRVTFSRKQSLVTDNVTLSDPVVTDNFEFYTISKANGDGRKADEKSPIRKAKYWYDVPIAAIPVIKKGCPKMPDYMNGRQYFLWWKNEFKENGAGPVILNPIKR